MTRDTADLGTFGMLRPAVSATQLRFEVDRTVLTPAGAPEFMVPIGPQALAARYWRGGAPSAWQIEQAIDQVETALMSQSLAHGARGWLASADPWLCALPGLQSAGASLTRDAIEVLFNFLAAAAETGRSRTASFAAEGEAAAALLVLRECMHHLGFDSIVSMAPGD
jgi:hypothetical protein